MTTYTDEELQDALGEAMTTNLLDLLTRAKEEMTHAPWELHHMAPCDVVDGNRVVALTTSFSTHERKYNLANAAHIATLRNALPALIEAVTERDALAKRVAELEQRLLPPCWCCNKPAAGGEIVWCDACVAAACLHDDAAKPCKRLAASPPAPAPVCTRCGWPLADSVAEGCVPGFCSQRPLPVERIAERLTEISADTAARRERVRGAPAPVGAVRWKMDPLPDRVPRVISDEEQAWIDKESREMRKEGAAAMRPAPSTPCAPEAKPLPDCACGPGPATHDYGCPLAVATNQKTLPPRPDATGARETMHSTNNNQGESNAQGRGVGELGSAEDGQGMRGGCGQDQRRGGGTSRAGAFASSTGCDPHAAGVSGIELDPAAGANVCGGNAQGAVEDLWAECAGCHGIVPLGDDGTADEHCRTYSDAECNGGLRPPFGDARWAFRDGVLTMIAGRATPPTAGSEDEVTAEEAVAWLQEHWEIHGHAPKALASNLLRVFAITRKPTTGGR